MNFDNSGIVINKIAQCLTGFLPIMPTFDATVLTGTASLLTTMPQDFEAVALVTLNVGLATTIDGACVAVTERSDTSKTVPIIDGVQYNVSAAAGTQRGFIPVTWLGASTRSIASGTLARPSIAISDFIPLSSIPRADGGALPLLLGRVLYTNRTYAAFQFSSAAEADAFGAALAPNEFASVVQTGVDGVATPANFTATWTAGANTTSVRIFGYLAKTRGTGELVLAVGDSIIRGLGAGGDASTNNAPNAAGGWTTQSVIALQKQGKQVGLINAGIGGQTSAQYMLRFQDWMGVIKPSIAMMPVYTPNDTPTTDSVLSAERLLAVQFMDICATAGTVPILVAPVPYSSGNEPKRLDTIGKIMSMKGAGKINPNVQGVYDPSNSSTGYWVSGMTIEGTHPSRVGYTTIANLAGVPVISQYLHKGA